MKILICRLLMVESLRGGLDKWAGISAGLITITYYFITMSYLIYVIIYILLLYKWAGLSARLQGLSSANLFYYYYYDQYK